jgi:hypothetical protein
MTPTATEFHPVQIGDLGRNPRLPAAVTLRAYEVYCHVFSPQPAMIDLERRNCRGGFGAGELIAFLYARSFPKEEWSARFEEALRRGEKA